MHYNGALHQSFKVCIDNKGKWEYLCEVGSYEELEPYAIHYGMIIAVGVVDHEPEILYKEDLVGEEIEEL